MGLKGDLAFLKQLDLVLRTHGLPSRFLAVLPAATATQSPAQGICIAAAGTRLASKRVRERHLANNNLPPSLAQRARRVFFRQMWTGWAAAITACGGGGGADGGSPTPAPPPGTPPAPTPTPSLTVTAAATRASAGDAAIALHAEVTGTSSTPSWELRGPGTLSARTGVDIQYVPPDVESLDDAETAVITAQLGSSLAREVLIELAPVVLPGRHWSVVRPGRSAWRMVAHANGTFVALSALGGSISHSADGVAWTEVWLTQPGALSLEDLAHGAAGWVAVNGQGHTATSVDGKFWAVHNHALGPSGYFYRVVFGNQIYLAYSLWKTWVSSDGIHWREGGAIGFAEIAYGNGLFIGVAPAYDQGTVVPHASTDGISWSPISEPGPLSSIVFRNSDFAAYSWSDMLHTTTTGRTWVSTEDINLKSGALGYAGGALFEYNTDTLGVAFDRQLVVQVTVIDKLSAPVSVAFGAGRYVGVSSLGWISSSTDALHWSTVLAGSVGHLTAVDFFKGSYVALSDIGWALRSADGITWNPSEVVPHLSAAQAPGFSAMAMTHGGGILVAVGSPYRFATTGMWMHSTDGMAWLPATTPAPAAPVTAIVHDGDRFVAVDRSGTVHASPDGDRWSVLGSVPGSPELTGIAYGNGVYVAVGRSGTLARSSDGSNWNLEPPIPSAVYVTSGGATMSAVTWDGNRFVAVGPDYTSAVSTDGRGWVAGDIGIPATTVAAANGVIVAASSGGGAMSSIDGLHWRRRATSDGASAMTYAQGRFVCVGPNSIVSVSDH